MLKFRVLVPITGFVAYEVEADSAETAKKSLLDGECDSRHSEYNESLDYNDYSVEELV